MMAGVGFDAEVVREVQAAPRRPPRWLKAPLLLAGTVRRFFTYEGIPMQLTLDGQEERGRVMMVLVGNIRGYAGVLQIAHEAAWDDGLLDVVVFPSVGLLGRLGNVVSVLTRRHKQRPGIIYRQARRIHVTTAAPLPVQADGDLVGETPMSFTIEPQALRIVRPQPSQEGGPGPRVSTVTGVGLPLLRSRARLRMGDVRPPGRDERDGARDP
jgi:diacylglycerol kinase family enzyme